ncbi:hypothetical protein [Burkholderia pseudomallei]|uniref:hypothetical protein n=1 Tax=Burkholderia pseudomallei TaxID=28450 RepID=UPI0021F73B41|nr:hypothetical protein [Burkholderia pseudomallei]MCW0082682.1 hypothetical protein [Burkholderia pseudomallei]
MTKELENGSYQFIHVDAYSREGSVQVRTQKNKKGGEHTTTITSMSAKDILEEQWRVEGACPHIAIPGEPELLFGVPPLDVMPMINEWAENTKDAKGRKLRKDGHCVLIGVASLPREMEDNFDDFAKDTINYLKEKYADRLKSVISHRDEAHPHLHFTVVPHIGEKFEDIHEGFKAANEAKRLGKKKGEQNLAYIEAMRAYQDEFSSKVAARHGLTRIGPKRRRLTRAEWQKEKQQAAYFSNASEAYRSGYKAGINRAKDQAKEIIRKAKIQAAEILKSTERMGFKFSAFLDGFKDGWHQPTSQAQNAARIANKQAEDEKAKRVEAENRLKRAKAEIRAEVTSEFEAILTELQAEIDKTNRVVLSQDVELERLTNEISLYRGELGLVARNHAKNEI